MADFIAKLGLDSKDFVAGLETAAQKAGVVTQALKTSADDSKGLSDGLTDAGKAADGLVESTGKIEDNLAKAGAGGGALDGLTAKFKEGQAAASAGGGIFGDVAGKLGQLASPVGAATAAIGALTAGIAASVTIGQEFQQNLAGVSAITGVTGAGLDDIGNRARELAKRFGGEASTQLQSFQGILSKFGAQLADTPDKLGTVSENINILAKAGGIDAAGAMDSLTASMLQFGVDTSDANALASESGRFINVLAASAKVGAAEIPQVADAVKVAGVAAKGAKVSFEETNAAIQVLAAGGKVGAEAGTALRNVLGKIAGEEVIPKPALDKLKSLGVDMSVVSDKGRPLAERLKELQKASGDATAFAQVFGTENAAAATILANGAQTVQDWTKEITGTDEATKQAATNMNTFSGQMDRAKSAIQDIAIGAFQALAPPVTAAVGFILDFAGVVSGAIGGLWSFLQPLVQPIIDFFEAGLLAPLNIAKAVITGFVSAAQIGFERFKEVIKPLQDALADLFSGVGEGASIMGALKVVFDAISYVVETYFVVVFGVATKVLEIIVSKILTLIDWVKQGIAFVKGIAQAVSDWAEGLVKTNTTISTIVNGISKFIENVKELSYELMSFLGIFDKYVNAKDGPKVAAKVETKPEETKKDVEDASKKNPAKIEAKVKVKKDDTKDITEEIRKQQLEIDKVAREAQEKSIQDENERAIQNLRNQAADRIAAAREQNTKIQNDEKITDAQKLEFKKLTASRVAAIESQLAAEIELLQKKQAEKQAAEAKKAFDAFEAYAKKQSETEKKKQEELAKIAEDNRKRDLQLKLESIDNERARTLAKQILDLSEKKRAVLASDRGTAEERVKIAERYQREIDELASGKDKSVEDQRAKIAREEAELIKALNSKKLSYDEYSKRILELQQQSSELEKQIEENKKAAQAVIEEATKAISDTTQTAVGDGIPVAISLKGLSIIKDDAIDTFLEILSAGKSYQDLASGTIKTVNDDIVASFELVEERAKKFLDFRRFGVIDNVQRLGEILTSSFAKAEASGQSFSASTQTAIQATNKAIASSLGRSIDQQTAKFNELRDKGEATYSQVAEIAVLSLGKAAVEGKNLAKESLKIIVESALKMVEINLVTLLTAFGATGPAGLLAGIGAVALLRGLAAAAFANAGYQDGGYTGGGGTSEVAGVVHGQEFVHTAGVTRRYRPLFEHLHKGGELSTWAIGVTGQLQTQNQPQPFVSTYGIETRLERLETAIVRGNRKFESMRAVQMTVEHDPSLIIKSQARNLEVRSARA